MIWPFPCYCAEMSRSDFYPKSGADHHRGALCKQVPLGHDVAPLASMQWPTSPSCPCDLFKAYSAPTREFFDHSDFKIKSVNNI